ncbi:hypothetical protein [Cyanobacterium sp. Dongsha4]|uniref:hypothetical protein n=1 Tax=Cyanobacterium sp. DS4 TaxID=2878255 RepID=UPI002E81ABA9|nr:hypothetical protein [Cyanobacterium sp. Dongsha4]WVL01058.1 hypothetical protein Dongsha4_02370 [Cyanobacterium sp. Dongsha4]
MIRESNLQALGNIKQLIIAVLILPGIILSFSLIIILGGITSSHPCFREYPSPSHKLVLTMESCGSLTVGYNYTISRNYSIFQKVKSRGKISPDISGKWYSRRFESLKIEWDSQETQIRWELKEYSTTGLAEDNSQMPIQGIINIINN